MTVIVKDGRFLPADPLDFAFTSLDAAGTDGALHLSADIDPLGVIDRVRQAPAIRIDFPSSHDGRGFSIATALRQAGYRGHMRASGHVLADQYPLALRCGFNDVEITGDLAARQPEEQWAEAATRAQQTYQQRLRTGRPVRSAA